MHSRGTGAAGDGMPKTSEVDQPGVAPSTNTSDPGPEGEGGGTSRSPLWYRRARLLGFVLLAGMTVYGLRELATGDWDAITEFWRAKLPWLPLILLLFVADLVLEGIAWIWVYERFKMRARDPVGALVYLSGNAGLLMPAQLGRLIRPDTMVRLRRGRLGDCFKAEGSVFVLDALSVVTLLAGMITWRIHPLLAPVAAVVLIGGCLFFGDRVADRLAGTRLDLPRDFWWSWQSGTIVLVEMLGWALHGVAFYLLVADLPGNLTLWDALFFAPGSAVLGVGTGLPGGVGATEGLLGATLRFNQVPAAHLALVVMAFRIITFWMRLPIGWISLAIVRRRAAIFQASMAKTGGYGESA